MARVEFELLAHPRQQFLANEVEDGAGAPLDQQGHGFESCQLRQLGGQGHQRANSRLIARQRSLLAFELIAPEREGLRFRSDLVQNLFHFRKELFGRPH